jgi:hypothetical protein
MSVGFWGASIVMAAIAMIFVAVPLMKRKLTLGSAGLAALLPVSSIGLYLVIGSPQAAGVDTTARATYTDVNAPASKSRTVASVADMVDGLATRLKDNPDDAKGWLLLARSYRQLQRISEAREAYRNAAALGEYDGELAALSGNPELLGAAGARIAGLLELSEAASEIVEPTDTVFVFARAVRGPSMPIAVVQRPASDLPLNFILSDARAMSPDARLSNFEEVVVTARISRSGKASEALKGLEAKSDAISVAEQEYLNLILD